MPSQQGHSENIMLFGTLIEVSVILYQAHPYKAISSSSYKPYHFLIINSPCPNELIYGQVGLKLRIQNFCRA